MINETIAHYRITSKLGQGGMGEVYRATDTKLGRDVAIKVLPESFGVDRDRVARFNREAKVLATLNHPNIAAIYGIERAEDTHALVMELVEGETLGERLEAEPMTVTEALDCCKQIAEALEAAHDKGIIHRDLKPENVKIDEDGRVKVLDFGLAKEAIDPGSAINQADSPTLTNLGTLPGQLLGTAPYMSPEQARAKPVDKRSDIWSFGCVLYECLTGKSMFEGEDITETLATIIKGEPDWAALPQDTPPTIALLLRKCLAKDRKRRLHDIADARIDLEQALGDPRSSIIGLSDQAIQDAASRRSLPRALVLGLVTVTALLTALGVWFIKPKVNDPMSSATRSIVRSMIQPRTKIADEALWHVALAVSPDGKRIAYVDQGTGTERMLVVHELSTSETRVISGSEGAIAPFFSRDSESLGFADHTRGMLKTVSVHGGNPTPLAKTPQCAGGAWLDNDTIIFAPGFDAQGQGAGLWRVSAMEGTATPLTRVDLEAGEITHRWPCALPEDRILFTSYREEQGIQKRRLEVFSMAHGTRQVVLKDSGFGRYVPSEHLVFMRNGSLFGARFDPKQCRLVGSPVPLSERVAHNATTDATQLAFSDTGLLTFIPAASRDRELVWVDDRGVPEPVGAPSRAYEQVSLAPDGQKIAVSIDSQNRDNPGANADIWLCDLPGGRLTPMTFNGMSILPKWLPDSKTLTYLRYEPGEAMPDLRRLTVDRSRQEDRLASVPEFFWLGYSIKKDLSSVLGVVFVPMNDQDIVDMNLRDEAPSHHTVVGDPSWQRGPVLSPDGNWFAYSSHDAGTWEVYVKPYPGPGGMVPISDGGGFAPTWDPNENKLYYRKADEMWMVTYEPGDTFRLAEPQYLFTYHSFGGLEVQTYAAAGNGKFLMIQEDLDSRTRIDIVSNWFEALKQLVPAGED